MANELYSEVVPVILHGDDLNAMYFSVENRSPFLDRRLVEFCARIPTEQLFRDGHGKSVLREALAGTVSDRVLHARRKVGFNANLLSLVDLAEPDVREWLLDDSPIYEHVRRDRIEELASAGFLPNSRSKFLFYFLSAKTFLEEIAS
jgi:asparagine synthase (glutamine-hydrolysing)